MDNEKRIGHIGIGKTVFDQSIAEVVESQKDSDIVITDLTGETVSEYVLQHLKMIELTKHNLLAGRQTPKRWRGGVNVPVGKKTQSRNEPCACGSGNKFKRCCGK